MYQISKRQICDDSGLVYWTIYRRSQKSVSAFLICTKKTSGETVRIWRLWFKEYWSFKWVYKTVIVRGVARNWLLNYVCLFERNLQHPKYLRKTRSESFSRLSLLLWTNLCATICMEFWQVLFCRSGRFSPCGLVTWALGQHVLLRNHRTVVTSQQTMKRQGKG